MKQVKTEEKERIKEREQLYNLRICLIIMFINT